MAAPQPPKPPAEQITLRSSFNLLIILATLHSRVVQPFLRDQIGSRAQGVYSFIAGVLMFYAACVAEDQFFMNFTCAWFVAVMAQRWTSAAYRKKNPVHAQYTGRPGMVHLFLPMDEGTARLVVEPLICFGAGFVLSQWSMNVGKLVGLAGVSLMLLERFNRRMNENREQAVIDARLESEQLASGVRERF